MAGSTTAGVTPAHSDAVMSEGGKRAPMEVRSLKSSLLDETSCAEVTETMEANRRRRCSSPPPLKRPPSVRRAGGALVAIGSGWRIKWLREYFSEWGDLDDGAACTAEVGVAASPPSESARPSRLYDVVHSGAWESQSCETGPLRLLLIVLVEVARRHCSVKVSRGPFEPSSAGDQNKIGRAHV